MEYRAPLRHRWSPASVNKQARESHSRQALSHRPIWFLKQPCQRIAKSVALPPAMVARAVSGKCRVRAALGGRVRVLANRRSIRLPSGNTAFECVNLTVLSKGVSKLNLAHHVHRVRKCEVTKMTDWETCAAVERIPGRLGGAWVFAGTRIPLLALYENLASGATINEFVEWFPGVDEQQVRAVLEHEAKALRAPATH